MLRGSLEQGTVHVHDFLGLVVEEVDLHADGTDVLRVLEERLASHGIAVGALHSHMLEETPRLFFMHFWANDDASALASGLRAALDAMNVKRAAQ